MTFVKPTWLQESEEFITVKEAARFLRCSLWLVYDSMHTPAPDGLPHKKIVTENSKRVTYRIPTKEFLVWAHDYSCRRKET